jgi:hypothetical protein
MPQLEMSPGSPHGSCGRRRVLRTLPGRFGLKRQRETAAIERRSDGGRRCGLAAGTMAFLLADPTNPCPIRWHQPSPGLLRRAGWSDRAEPRRELPRGKPGDVAGLRAASGIGRFRLTPIAGGPARAKRRGDHPPADRRHPHQPDINLAERLFDHTVVDHDQIGAGRVWCAHSRVSGAVYGVQAVGYPSHYAVLEAR